jgi:hypothetical protein
MNTPKSIKLIFVCVLLVALSSSLMLFTGCTYGPSKEFVGKMDERVKLHLPRLKYFIENASIAQLEKMLEKKEGIIDQGTRCLGVPHRNQQEIARRVVSI